MRTAQHHRIRYSLLALTVSFSTLGIGRLAFAQNADPPSDAAKEPSSEPPAAPPTDTPEGSAAAPPSSDTPSEAPQEAPAKAEEPEPQSQEESNAQAPEEGASAPAAATGNDEDASGLDDLDLLQLLKVQVSTATKTAESLDDAPAIITVVSRQEILRWGYESVAEALQHVVGFYLADDHIIPNAGVRGVTGGLGAESGVIKVMIDGRSVAFRTTSGNWLGVEAIPLSSIRQIEIIRGPASALYGADAFLGVINIITLAPEEIPTVDGRLSFGVDGANPGGRFDVSGGGQWGRFDLLLGAAGELQDRTGLRMPAESPYALVPGYNRGHTVSRDLKRESLVLQLRGGYRVPGRGHLILSAYASEIKRGGDFAHWSQLSAGTDTENRGVGTVIQLGQYRLTADGLYAILPSLDLATQATYFQGGVLPQDRIEVASDLYWVKRDFGYRGIDANFEGRWHPSQKFNLILGVETLYDREALPNSQRISKDTGDVLGQRTKQSSVDLTNVGAYASSNLKVIDQYLKLTGGLRYDYHSIYGNQLTGRVGTTSHLTSTVVAKLLYGSAFKAPSPYLLYAKPLRPGDVIGNASLKPQLIDTLESQVSWKPFRWFEGSTGVSYSVLRDKAEFTPQGINQTARNVAKQKVLAWETRLDSRDDRWYTAYTSFEFISATRDLGQEGYAAWLLGTRNVAYPPWIARAGASLELPLHRSIPLEIASQGILVGPRRSADTSTLENVGSFELPSYFLWNASLSTHDLYLIPGHETTFSLRAKNLLGVAGPDPGYSGFEYPLRKRSIFFEIRHTL